MELCLRQFSMLIDKLNIILNKWCAVKYFENTTKSKSSPQVGLSDFMIQGLQ
jgi:hypothetical protein